MGTLSQDQIDALRRIESLTIANAIEAFSVRAPNAGYASLELRSMFPDLAPVVGYGVTCTADSTTAGDDASSQDEAFWKAIRAAPKPAIVVMKDVSIDRLHSCHAGDVMSTIAQTLGAVAFVTDGGVRDLAGVRQRAPGFQLFAAGVVGSHDLPRIIEVGVDVSIFGVTIHPGDLLHGEANGQVSIPVLATHLIGRVPERINQLRGTMIIMM